MAVRLHCDRCGRYVQTIPNPNDLSVFRKEVICKECNKTEVALVQFADKLKGKFLARMDAIIQEAKAELKAELEKMKSE